MAPSETFATSDPATLVDFINRRAEAFGTAVIVLKTGAKLCARSRRIATLGPRGGTHYHYAAAVVVGSGWVGLYSDSESMAAYFRPDEVCTIDGVP